jgi:hypothetical protein
VCLSARRILCGKLRCPENEWLCAELESLLNAIPGIGSVDRPVSFDCRRFGGRR